MFMQAGRFIARIWSQILCSEHYEVESVCYSQILVPTYQITSCHIPEENNMNFIDVKGKKVKLSL
jgi:hypothetical protein